MKLKTTFLSKLLFLVAVVLMGAGTAWGQSDYSTTYTSNVTLSTTGGIKAEACKVIINSTEYDGIKIGTGSAVGACNITIPAGTKYLHMHVSGWSGVTNLKLVVTGITPAPSDISVEADAGVANSSPFTLQGTPSSSDYYKVITFSSALESETTLTFTTSGKKRCVIFGVNSEEESGGGSNLTPNNLALTGAPVELEFDMYNNTTAQVVSYTTSSTGAVSIADNDYAMFAIDQTNKTITVTPTAATPSVQTITVSQAADATYAAGTATFTLTIDDSTPGVKFIAGTDVGLTTGNNSPDEMSKDGVTISCTDAAFATTEYRFYSGSTTTISTNSGTITKIVFTECDSSKPVSNLSATGYSNGTWSGNATSVVFTASAQARASKIVVTVDQSAPSITITNNNELAYDATSGSFDFTINNPVTGGATTVSEEVEWISNAAISGNSVTFNTTANEANTTRSGVITLTYNGTIVENVTVTQAANPNASGAANNPYTVAEALAASPAEGVYVTGTISEITEVNTSYGNATYKISDGTNEMIIYHGKYLNNANFTSADQIAVGDVVKVYGNLSEYNNVNQMAQGNYIVTLTHKELSSIELSGTYTTTFVEGSTFNHEGVVVTANYSDNTTADVTAQATFSNPDMTQVGEQTVTVSYGGKTATYTITITAAPTYTATFSVNGTTSTQDFKEGAAIVFPNVTDPAGMTFMGWTETAITGTQDAAPTFVTSATMGTGAVTFYAVFAVVTGSVETATLTATHTTNSSGYGDHTYTDDKGNEWGGNTNEPYENSVARIGLRNTSGSYLESPTFSGNVTEIKIMTYNGSGSNRTFNIKSTMDGSADLGTVSAPANTKLTEEQTATLTGTAFNKFYIVPTGAVGFSYIKVTYGNLSTSNYCTTVPTSIDVAVTSAGYATFVSDFDLDYSSVTGLKAYKASVSGTDISFTKVTTVPAGQGVLLQGAEDTYQVPITTSGVTAWTDNAFIRGTGAAVDSDAGNGCYNYILNNGSNGIGFYKANGQTVAKNRAYLQSNSNTARIAINFDDEATGVSDVRGKMSDVRSDVFDLQGRRVAAPQKGLYIMNGKKVIFK